MKVLKAIKIKKEYAPIIDDRKKTLSPINIIVTPIYIGLRENLYSPNITNFFVGSAGDNVPRPWIAKLATHISITTDPNINIDKPKK